MNRSGGAARRKAVSVKERLRRMGRANEEARRKHLRSLTPERAAELMEGLLSHPMKPPSAKKDHPVSLSHRRRG